VLHTSYVL
jgi:hypothetical protein